jgi:DNA-binding PadR family transcriptional regulator
MKLTPTSFVLLTLLARRSMSAFELNNTMYNSVIRAYWLRAKSHVYAETKKLAENGLVTCTTEQGLRGRERTVYHINAAGHEALQAWLQEPTDIYDAQIEYRGMLKYLCSDQCEVAQMRQNLEGMREQALADARAVAQHVENTDYDSRPMGTSGMPFNASSLHFLIDLVEARLKWVDQTLENLANIESTADSAANRALAARERGRLLERIEGLVSEERPGAAQSG